MAAIFTVFLLGSLWGTYGLPLSPLTIQPEHPLVKRGGTIQLNCSIDCPGGKVQWEGLDTDMGDIASYGTSSILTLTNAAVGMEGLKLCTGQCQRHAQERRVDLEVYSFPDALQLDSWPRPLVVGQAATLSCSLSNVYPPGALELSWSQGKEQLAPSEEEEEEIEGSEDLLFRYRSVLKVPRIAENVTYGCSATLRLKHETFRQRRAAAVSSQVTEKIPRTTEAAAVASYPPFQTEKTSHETTPGFSPSTATTSSPSPFPTESSTTGQTSKPTSVSSTAGQTSALTPESLAISTNHTDVTEQPTTISPSPKATTPSPETQTQPPVLKTHNSTLVNATPSKDRCRPVITTVSPQGTVGGVLAITCLAADCGKDVQIQWVKTPAPESRYHKEEAAGRSTLTVHSLSMEHQGVYRCVTVPGQSRTDSLRVVVSNDTYDTDAIVAIGTTGSLLGLIITGYVFYRLRRR